MAASSGLIRCGNIATLSTDRVVVGRPQTVGIFPTPGAANKKQVTVFKSFIISSPHLFLVAGALLSSDRLSQPLSERS
jgi:hypothetical protein